MKLKSMVLLASLVVKLVTESMSGCNRADLGEVPRISHNWSDFENYTGYAYYGDMLIIRDTMYQLQEGEYRKTGTVQELVEIEENTGVEYAQYQNLLVVNRYDEGFRVYDMDTWDYFLIPEHTVIWCVYQGHLLYAEGETLFCTDLKDGGTREFDILDTGGNEDTRICRFGFSENGKMAAGKYNGESGCHEIWMLEMKESGELDKKKVWETGEWEFGYWLDFNRYGVVLAGKGWSMKETEWGTTKYEAVVVTEEGEERVIRQDLLNRACFFLDDGYFVNDETEIKTDPDSGWIWNEHRFASSVSRYDYEGNKVGSYRLVSHELISQGYYLSRLLYDDGKLTGFYVQEGTDNLYISQINVR